METRTPEEEEEEEEEKKRSKAKAENNNLNEKNSTAMTIDFPDEILHHIFSFLPIKSLTQTTLLSKHWNRLSLWRTHPHLIFPHISPYYEATGLVPTVLSRRQPESKITTFRLSGYISSSCLRDCIDRVMYCRIEQLELGVNLDCSFDLPMRLFRCSTLRVLTLNHQDRRNLDGRHFSLTVPREGFGLAPTDLHTAVHTLSLTNIYLVEGSDFFLGGNFPFLRKLCLKNVRGMIGCHLNIKCPCLEDLKLDGLEMKELDVSGVRLLELELKRLDMTHSVKIFAPSLRSLHWENHANVEITAESFKCLNKGFICFLYEPGSAARLQGAFIFLCAIRFARSICFGSQALEILAKIDRAGGLPCSFNNLRTLDLETDMRKLEIEGIVCLLRSSPILHTITIDSTSWLNSENATSKEERYLESQKQTFKSLEHHLKVVRIHIQNTRMLTRVHKSAANLVRFFLQHGRVLQEMTVTLKSRRGDRRILQPSIRSRMMKFPRASSNVKISLVYWRE
ncbi:putative F-box/FBD/LRR-repeat protein At4g03220 [Rhododendron vialii]|uniref:putative F-box/FBD/LRR-repeat protein At4g03220 n=1 Tax=Rhododendron vialii TaxID=182163 RepID=UPI00265F95F2|nr:putative F-box/FBD/LRR-repeat protein At4g03220 [Rhododendron vialii]